jgi:protein-S-isoprenylcysteine O-methyltransferase Ste14
MRPSSVILGLWLLWSLSWIAAAFWSRPAEARLGFRAELPFRISLVIGALIFAVPAHGYEGPLRLWTVTRNEAWVCVALIAAGASFSWWARLHLGSLWSGTITKKSDHQLVDTGPYAIVRHPIYTGFLLAVLATAAAKGTILGLLGLAFLTFGIWMKARQEEGWLRANLSADSYDAYRRRVPMLIPFTMSA